LLIYITPQRFTFQMAAHYNTTYPSLDYCEKLYIGEEGTY